MLGEIVGDTLLAEAEIMRRRGRSSIQLTRQFSNAILVRIDTRRPKTRPFIGIRTEQDGYSGNFALAIADLWVLRDEVAINRSEPFKSLESIVVECLVGQMSKTLERVYRIGASGEQIRKRKKKEVSSSLKAFFSNLTHANVFSART